MKRICTVGYECPLLVHGAPRGGTTYLARLLQEAGLFVAHEGVGMDGCVSGFHHTDHPWYPPVVNKHPSDYRIGERWWLIRHPAPSTLSLARLMSRNPKLWQWYRELGFVGPQVPTLDEDWAIAGLHVWFCTHRRIERLMPDDGMRLTLEGLVDHWPAIALELGLDCPMPNVAVPNPTRPEYKVPAWVWEYVRAQLPRTAASAERLYGEVAARAPASGVSHG